MLKITRRPITDEERAIVESWRFHDLQQLNDRCYLGCQRLPVLLIGAAIGALLGGGIALLSPTHEFDMWLLLLGAGIGCTGGLAVVIIEYLQQRQQILTFHIQPFEEVEVVHAEADMVVGYVKKDGTIEGYAFQVEADTLLIVHAREAAYLAQQDTFPCQAFNIVRHPEGRIIGVQCLGEALPVKFTEIQSFYSSFPCGMMVIQGTFDDLWFILASLGTETLSHKRSTP